MERRYFLQRSLAVAGMGYALQTRRSIAATSIGNSTLRTVSDGHLILPTNFVIGDLPTDEAVEIGERFGVIMNDQIEAPCNLTLWQRGSDVILFDAGAGPSFMPTTGMLIDALTATGISPQDVTHVIFTHGHPDHLWGALDDFEEPLFSNARHYLGATEHAYWSDPATLDTIGADRQSFAAGAARRLEILGEGMTLFGPEDEIVEGVAAINTPGHTPGHLSFRLTDSDESITVIGDAIGNGHIALARPDWPSPADQDAKQGIETRMALLAELASSGERVVGFHFPDGGIGRIRSAADGYAFQPE